MTTTPSFALKLERAREHLQSFDHEAKTWIDGEPYGIVDEPDPEPAPHPVTQDHQMRRFRVTQVDLVPHRLSLILGDCVFNLRATLDHLALSLAKSFTPHMTVQQVQGSEFPIFHTYPMDLKTESKKIGCIAPAARAIIKALQPHHLGHGYRTHPLWQIHELNRIDKHRELTICTAVARKDGHNSIAFSIPENMNIRGYAYAIATGGGPLKQDAVLMRVAWLPVDSSQEAKRNPHIPLEIAFGQSGPAPLESVVPTLKALCDFVCDTVMAQLTKFL